MDHAQEEATTTTGMDLDADMSMDVDKEDGEGKVSDYKTNTAPSSPNPESDGGEDSVKHSKNNGGITDGDGGALHGGTNHKKTDAAEAAADGGSAGVTVTGDTHNSNTNTHKNIEKESPSGNNGSGKSRSGLATNGSAANNNNKNNNNLSAATSETAAPAAPLPLLKGSLSYINNELTRKHVIQGTWNFESSDNTHAPQRFELVRQLGPNEDPTELPKDGVFNGSFSLIYTHISAKGKKKERSRLITESGVKIKFSKKDEDDGGDDDAYDVNGQGTNQYGVFSIFGTAVRDKEDKKQFKVELRKRYLTSPSSSTSVAPSDTSPEKKLKNKSKKRKLSNHGTNLTGNGASSSSSAAGTNVPLESLPEPSTPCPSGVVCLRGKIARDSSAQDGVVHSVSGMWSSGLDVIESDPNNERGLCNQFEYEYRGTVATDAFPISGKYTGWFNLTIDDGTRTRIPERDVTLKFKKNNKGFYNVEGRGSNMFGKYSITGTLDNENVITIFRHFAPIKAKATKKPPVTTSLPLDRGSHLADGQGSGGAADSNDGSSSMMTLDEVKIPGEGDGNGNSEGERAIPAPLTPPVDGTYSVVSRGILKVNEDGAHTCTGKWAITRNHYNSNIASNFHFGLEEHHAKVGANGSSAAGELPFPVDSANYKGSFKMKRGTAKLQSVVDKQIVMKFRKNTSGSFNVYGKGVNSIGTFNLQGTLILYGTNSGHVELYRMYLQAPAPVPSSNVTKSQTPASSQQSSHRGAKSLPTAKNASSKKGSANSSAKSPAIASSFTPAGPAVRRESSRQTKLPSRLEDSDPQSMKARLMKNCAAVLKTVREKDVLGGSFFAEPVDPVAHGIPTYHQIITNPMDLGTIQAKMDANEIQSPEEFARLTRLVFENAIKFNIDPTHVVHQAARNLLTIFNNRFRDVERLLDKKKPTKKELKEMKKKEQEEQKRLERERKRKREEEADPRLGLLRQMQTSSQDMNKSLDSFRAAISTGMSSGTSVTRNEFNLMSNVIYGMHAQMTKMQALLSTLVTPQAGDSATTTAIAATSGAGFVKTSQSIVAQDALSSLPPPVESAAKKPKRTKKKTEKPTPTPAVAKPAPAPAPVVRKVKEEVPLTLEEQEELTEAINTMSPEKLEGVIDIIRESADLNDDEEEEIDLEIDQLKVSTQRKLMNFVLKVSITDDDDLHSQLCVFSSDCTACKYCFSILTSMQQYFSMLAPACLHRRASRSQRGLRKAELRKPPQHQLPLLHQLPQ